MWCAIYKSDKKPGSYLFIERKDDFSRVPELLLSQFPAAQLVMVIDLDKRDHLAMADINRVRVELIDKGFYLQIPPPISSLLAEHRQTKGLDK
jgi:uncharacterized protein YcgL (UPF0745 family)